VVGAVFEGEGAQTNGAGREKGEFEKSKLLVDGDDRDEDDADEDDARKWE
jgi:hypothetical protein